MDNTYLTTEHKKCQHLTDEERHEIEVRLKDKWTIYGIAKHLKRPYNTIKNEIARGTVLLYNGKVKRYYANTGKRVYLEHRSESRRKYRCLQVAPFLNYVVTHFKKDKWSLDVCFGKALTDGAFQREDMVCTKTLYHYVDMGFLPIKNLDLPEKVSRKQNKGKRDSRKNKRVLGKSIEERPKSVDSREEFGHWEIDSILGKIGESEPAILSLTERKLRMSIWLKVADHTAKTVNETLRGLFEDFGDKCGEVFKTITADNGSEFAELAAFEQMGIGIYYTHPYTSCEKATVENHNKLLRRFVPKGKSLNDYSADDILFFADVINGLPRKILGYHTPEELFDKELDRIYAA